MSQMSDLSTDGVDVWNQIYQYSSEVEKVSSRTGAYVA